MRIVCISDTHELHRELEIPPADLLIHAGDWTFFSKNRNAVADFNTWLREQRLTLGSVIVPGNHEFYLESDERRRSWTDHANVLIGEAITLGGLKIWGSPVTRLYGGAFGISNPADRARHYAQIPEDTHILATHSPPFGILDCAPGSAEHRGCKELLKAVERITPLLHIFGHVHSGYGTHVGRDTTFVNAALLGADGGVANSPLVFDLPESHSDGEAE